MKHNHELYSLAFAIVSIIVSLYFVKETAVQVGLVITIFLAIISVYIIQKFNQVDVNTRMIKQFNIKLNLSERLNKIENDIVVIKGVVEMLKSKKGQTQQQVILILLVILVIYIILKALNKI